MYPPNNPPPDSSAHLRSKPLLCYVTDRRALQAGPSTDLFEPLLEKIERIAGAGVDWIQIREKDLSGRDSAFLAREALRRISKLSTHRRPAARILVNDRLDVALAEDAGGVQLGEASLPVAEAKRLLLAAQASRSATFDFLVGVSCHSLDAARAAASSGAGYILFGPVFATPSKASFGSPQGLERLAEVCHSVTIPVLAIGGITLENASSCLSAGASGIAAIRLFQDLADPATLVHAIREQKL